MFGIKEKFDDIRHRLQKFEYRITRYDRTLYGYEPSMSANLGAGAVIRIEDLEGQNRELRKELKALKDHLKIRIDLVEDKSYYKVIKM